MRIAQVAPPWLAIPPKGYGGIEWVVSLLADGLADRGHDVTLVATGDSETRARLEAFFIEAPGTAHINSIWHDAVHSLFAFRDPDRFDLFHVHTPYSALAAGAALGRPLVHTVHGAFTEEMRALYTLVGDRAWYVAISEAQREHMPALPYAGVVYNGVDMERYPFRESKEDFVLFLGRAAPEKGAHRAVLAARAAGAPLVIAVKTADPAEEEHLEREVRPLLHSRDVVLGEISFEEKVDLLSRARAVLFPIDWDEPFGLVMTEAMACGTPVIATPRGSVPEVIAADRTGFVVPLEDYPERASEALRHVGEIDPAACRAWVAERFSKEAMVDGYERVYERVLAASTSPFPAES
jgi:glycosyltransferase involved in cell wall biosynthesis